MLLHHCTVNPAVAQEFNDVKPLGVQWLLPLRLELQAAVVLGCHIVLRRQLATLQWTIHGGGLVGNLSKIPISAKVNLGQGRKGKGGGGCQAS
jgi:hypothetical protein